MQNEASDALDKLQTWMTKTVAPRYMETCFEYSETVRVWYENLKKQVGTNEYTIKREIRDTYKHAINHLQNLLSMDCKLGAGDGEKF
jgi:cyclopropane fatty-acyl-phospholipid synthase-like methyltransferase